MRCIQWLFFILTGSLLQAQECAPIPIDHSNMVCCRLFDPNEQPHSVYAGVNLFGFSLSSSIDSAEISGTRFAGGIQIGYIYQKPEAFYANLDFLFAAGHNFNETINHTPISINHDCFDFIHADLSLGYPFQKKCQSIIPFASIGIYSIQSAESHMGIDETLPYAGIGTKWINENSSSFHYGCDLRLFWSFASALHIDADPLSFSKTINQPGGQLSIPLAWHFGEAQRWEFDLTPYFLSLTFSQLQLTYGLSCLLQYHF